MRKPDFPGSFILHPVFIVSMISVLINNLWFKASRISPMLAGKITDVAIMIYLPALICLGVVFIRHSAQSLELRFKNNSSNFSSNNGYIPSHATIVISIAISAFMMTMVKVSDTCIKIYAVVIGYLNCVLFEGRVIAKPVKDKTDLFSLIFLLIPYIILKRANDQGGKSGSAPQNQAL